MYKKGRKRFTASTGRPVIGPENPEKLGAGHFELIQNKVRIIQNKVRRNNSAPNVPPHDYFHFCQKKFGVISQRYGITLE